MLPQLRRSRFRSHTISLSLGLITVFSFTVVALISYTRSATPHAAKIIAADDDTATDTSLDEARASSSSAESASVARARDQLAALDQADAASDTAVLADVLAVEGALLPPTLHHLDHSSADHIAGWFARATQPVTELAHAGQVSSSGRAGITSLTDVGGGGGGGGSGGGASASDAENLTASTGSDSSIPSELSEGSFDSLAFNAAARALGLHQGSVDAGESASNNGSSGRGESSAWAGNSNGPSANGPQGLARSGRGSFEPESIPEPATLLLMGAGLTFATMTRLRRRIRR